MRYFSMAALALGAVLFGTAVHAQQPASPPPPPDYGMPITQEQAMKVAAAAQAQAKKANYLATITIVGPTGELIYFTKMDGANHSGTAISQQKARTAATFRRSTKVFQDALATGGPAITLLTVPGIIASAGGIPLVAGGKIIGAIGISGGPNSSVDAETAQAGVDALK